MYIYIYIYVFDIAKYVVHPPLNNENGHKLFLARVIAQLVSSISGIISNRNYIKVSTSFYQYIYLSIKFTNSRMLLHATRYD